MKKESTVDFETIEPDAPFVEINGTKFYADRFYLNQIETLHHHHNNEQAQSSPSNNDDTFHNAPPHFDRIKFINSLDLEAVIVATYKFEEQWMCKSFPRLFSDSTDCPVPTLVLHGYRGWSKRFIDYADESLFGSQVCFTEVLPTWESKRTLKKNYNGGVNHNRSEKMKRRKTSNKEVIDLDDDDNHSVGKRSPSPYSSNKSGCRERGGGVHHPKYWLLFEKCGSLVIIISTANCTPQNAVDGTWIQRFHRKSDKTTKSSNTVDLTSDFGYVLADFLHAQGKAAATHGYTTTPDEFMGRYIREVSNLKSFRRTFDFSVAAAVLISTVPGEHSDTPLASSHSSVVDKKSVVRKKKKHDIYYGPQRVAEVITKCTSTCDPWLPRNLLSRKDKFFAQATSLSSIWSEENFDKFLSQYYQPTGYRKKYTFVIWPTDEFVENSGGAEHFLSSSNFSEVGPSILSRFAVYKARKPCQIFDRTPHFKSYARVLHRVLMRSGSHTCGKNMIDTDDDASRCISESTTSTLNSESCDDDSLSSSSSSVSSVDEKYEKNDTDICFAWFMMTSACISYGAQGQILKNGNSVVDGFKKYFNFELGLLFCSRFQGTDTDRVYCLTDNSTIRGRDSRIQLKMPTGEKGNGTEQRHKRVRCIRLPVPYQIGELEMYEADAENYRDFKYKPFMHSVTDDTAFAGNMRILPVQEKVHGECV